jgi:hypothetical protein
MFPTEIVQRITKLNSGIQKFWSKSHGWAPVEAAGLLAKSRLDWQVSLSKTLTLWLQKKPLTPGELILAWSNLGSLVEGTLKTFLSVWYKDYIKDIEYLKKSNAYHYKKGKPLEPDALTLGPLALYFKNKKFLSAESTVFINLVHARRNAIHAFKGKDIGTADELQKAVASYLKLLREVNRRLPYPDDVYVPQEV